MRLRTLFFALMALAAVALVLAAMRSNPSPEAEPETSPVVHFSWSVRAMPRHPVPDARVVAAVVPAAAVAPVVRSARLSRRVAGLAAARRARGVPRVSCARAGTLRFNRYEDGSATLTCAGHVLVRVSVPG